MRIQDRIILETLWTLIRLIGLLPIGLRGNVGAAIGKLIGLFSFRERQIAKLQLENVLGTSEASKFSLEIFAQMGRNLLESCNLRGQHLNSDFLDPESRESLTKLSADSAPRIFLSAHTGNWDFLASSASSLGMPVVVIGREAKLPWAQELLDRIRRFNNIETFWRSDRLGVQNILKHLAKNGSIAALIDQDTTVRSEQSLFLGKPASTPVGLLQMGLKKKLQFYASFCQRSDKGRYRFRFLKLNGSSEAELLREYHDFLEELIRETPSQWMWNHKRWRSLPTGERLSSKEYIEFLKPGASQKGSGI